MIGNERNLKTVTKVQKFLEDMKNKKADIKNLEKKSYNNYEQRKYDNFDSLYANVQKLNIFILYGYKTNKCTILIFKPLHQHIKLLLHIKFA